MRLLFSLIIVRWIRTDWIAFRQADHSCSRCRRKNPTRLFALAARICCAAREFLRETNRNKSDLLPTRSSLSVLSPGRKRKIMSFPGWIESASYRSPILLGHSASRKIMPNALFRTRMESILRQTAARNMQDSDLRTHRAFSHYLRVMKVETRQWILSTLWPRL
jgi:hypothetical protein